MQGARPDSGAGQHRGEVVADGQLQKVQAPPRAQARGSAGTRRRSQRQSHTYVTLRMSNMGRRGSRYLLFRSPLLGARHEPALEPVDRIRLAVFLCHIPRA